MKRFMTALAISLMVVASVGFALWKWKGEFLTGQGTFFGFENVGVVLAEEKKDSGDLSSRIEVTSGDVLGITDDEVKEEKKTETVSQSTASTPSNETQNLESHTPYYIKINNAQNVVTIYAKDEAGNYTIPFKAMVCSTGTETPSAGKKYKITTYKTRWNALQGNVYGQYATQIIGNILFHSVPYTAKKNSALEYWEYDKLGTKASLGCIRLTVEDAKWVYDNIAAGTIVEFYEDANNPGPLGKPIAQKISDNEECRGWDPTDPAEENPWREEKRDTEDDILPIVSLETEMESGEMQKSEIPDWLNVEKRQGE